MNEQNILEKSYLALIEFLLLSKQSVSKIGAKYKLTTMQALTLLLLSDPRTMNSFTRVYNCDASNVTGIVDGLEIKKLARRYEDKTDRRVKLIETTAKGKEVRRKLLDSLTGNSSFIMKKLSIEEVSIFVSLMQKIISD